MNKRLANLAGSESATVTHPSNLRSIVADSVIKNVRKNREGDITHVGVKGLWEWTVAATVASIEARSNTFFVECPQRADVYIASTPAGKKFLKTTADTTTKNNLDNLPPLD
ncbi:DUF3892 domain-containing protein [Microbacterium oleivorans]|uniref:DUF3892 domain-containing protein n=1 Tax=Microbacterium oleivorans TaxID=273677 RepID=A0A4R5YJY1_9MICO|nr:DUF3892 domain-containing protein [Microbacterium oleivorans]